MGAEVVVASSALARKQVSGERELELGGGFCRLPIHELAFVSEKVYFEKTQQ